MKRPKTTKNTKKKRATKKPSAVAAGTPSSALKFHRFVVQLIDTPRNAAAIDRLHEAAKGIIGMADGPMGCIKRETVELGKYSTTRPPIHRKGCICVQCEQNDERIRAENERLRETLYPFSTAGDRVWASHGDWDSRTAVDAALSQNDKLRDAAQ
tara:strand:+ start:451 stop:915 length:465 start_codon:yes stop_codon:yes gene_type:complete